MNAKVHQQLRKRKLLRRISIEHGKWQSPMIRPATTKIQLAEKQQAVTCGGLAAIVELVNTLGLRKELNGAANVLKMLLPYDEADHILNIALNLLALKQANAALENRSLSRRRQPRSARECRRIRLGCVFV